MIELSGDLGKFFVSYKLVATTSKWQIIRDTKVLGAQVAEVTAKISWLDEFLAGYPVTKVSFKLGNVFWSWVRIQGDPLRNVSHERMVNFAVIGDPTITLI